MPGRPHTAVPNIFASEGAGIPNNIPLLDADFADVLSFYNDSAIGWNNYAADTGSANTYLVTLSAAPSAYIAGMLLSVLIGNGNTGASTINVSSLGVKSIVAANGSALTGGELVAGSVVLLQYDGTSFRLVNVISTAFKQYYGADTTNSGSYAVTVDSSFRAVTGVIVSVLPSNTNAGSVTLNVNGTGTSPVATRSGFGLSGSEIAAHKMFTVMFDGSSWRLLTSINRYYTGTNPGNVGIECGGYNSVSISIAFTTSTSSIITLNHLSVGVPVIIKIGNSSGSGDPYQITANDENVSALQVWWFGATSLSGGGATRLDGANQTLGAGQNVLLMGMRTGPELDLM